MIMELKTRFSTQEEYIQYVAPAVQRACKRMYLEQDFLVYPEIIIAMMCHENGYGQDKSCFVLNDVQNFLGMKSELLNNSDWYTLWGGKSINKLTPEVYNHQEVKIHDDFRVYKDPEECALDFLCFLRWAAISGKCPTAEPKYYPVLHTINNPYEQIRYIHKRGYSTGLYYSDRIIEKCQKWHLQVYDDLSNVDASKYWPANAPIKGGENKVGIKINKNPYGLVTHKTSKRSGSIDYIYIHYVGALGTAKDNVVYYSTDHVVKASADFYVSQNGDIWQYNMDPVNRYCWAVGGGKQSPDGGKYYGKATNANGVSIEMCVKSTDGKAPANPNDKRWYITPETFKNTVELTKYLMKLYNVPASRVIRHFDVNGKYCPGIVGWNYPSGSEAEWNKFKKAIDGVEVAPVVVPEKPVQTNTVFKVQLGAYKRKGNGLNKLKMAQEKIAPDAFITDLCSDGYYRVQVGAFNVYDNAVKLRDDIKNSKLSDACIKEYPA